ncbi:uncharacterized protein LOC111939388 isoform X2 [Cyanistes caeruleus]|uniref:uncharacterized protein LOC111939388 isoform X2 n=1 Tax=Cyanistes caeruleus TaxID=156563 RepID=UPI000CDB585F|nr:uncharacterized protein LOC111939388 isoform X2 [Cyanistes caeruleus]
MLKGCSWASRAPAASRICSRQSSQSLLRPGIEPALAGILGVLMVPVLPSNPQALNNFVPGSSMVWEPSVRVVQPVLAVPEAGGCRWGGGDLLQQCLWAAGITEQLLEAEAKRDQLPVASHSVPRILPGAGAQQPLLQPLVQHLGPFPGLQPAMGHLGGQQVVATALPSHQVVFLPQPLQVPQRIILQVKQPGPTTLTLLPSPASCVLGSGQGPRPPAHKPHCHPHSATPSHPGAAALVHSSIPTPHAVGIELRHGENFRDPKCGKMDYFVYF